MRRKLTMAVLILVRHHFAVHGLLADDLHPASIKPNLLIILTVSLPDAHSKIQC